MKVTSCAVLSVWVNFVVLSSTGWAQCDQLKQNECAKQKAICEWSHQGCHAKAQGDKDKTKSDAKMIPAPEASDTSSVPPSHQTPMVDDLGVGEDDEDF